MQILVKLDLPREERGGLQEMVGSAGLIPTRADERARLMYALSGELEKTIETYDRVVLARVHVVIPDTDMSLSADPAKGAKPSATVVIKYTVTEVPAKNIRLDVRKPTVDIRSLMTLSLW